MTKAATIAETAAHPGGTTGPRWCCARRSIPRRTPCGPYSSFRVRSGPGRLEDAQGFITTCRSISEDGAREAMAAKLLPLRPGMFRREASRVVDSWGPGSLSTAFDFASVVVDEGRKAPATTTGREYVLWAAPRAPDCYYSLPPLAGKVLLEASTCQPQQH